MLLAGAEDPGLPRRRRWVDDEDAVHPDVDCLGVLCFTILERYRETVLIVFFLIFLRVHMLALGCSREAREAVGGEEREGYRETWERCWCT